ncbi:neutral protease [Xylaria bambusicola]|uniref:neutral protease n=1 Tax=Xylaria bambusicola TaxID=326684 RepID=UPI0020087A23|nr:neutral protease [Xylaria bambusicola]KAI0512490.1 neutral protease [Xylaria bambusicola]
MKFFAGAALLASVASAASIDNAKRASPLDVKIEMVGNSGIKASITNTGSSDLKVLKTGSLLDSVATEKVKVYQGKNQVKFSGLRLRMMANNLPEAGFQTIKAGKTVSATFDAAELHDLSAGGAYDIVSKGALQYAAVDSNKIEGSVPYSSNVISTKVDGSKASAAFKSFHTKREAVQDDCSGSELEATVNGINGAAELAQAAASAASSDDDKLVEFFGTTSVRDQVVDVFNKVADETSSTSSGAAYYCTDVYSACSNGVLAYTLPSEDFIVNCPLFFSDLPAASSQCHAQDQQSTALHETTHLSEIAGTDDLGYGYSAATALSTQDALNNADSYALFAQAVYAGC